MTTTNCDNELLIGVKLVVRIWRQGQVYKIYKSSPDLYRVVACMGFYIIC